MGLNALHTRPAREADAFSLRAFWAPLTIEESSFLACVCADSERQGLSPCADPGGGSVQTGSCSTAGAVGKALHL